MKKKYSSGGLDPKRLQKFLLFMTLKIFVLCCSLTTVYGAALAQSRVDVEFRNQTLFEVLVYLQKNTDYKFIYRKDLVENVRVNDVSLTNATLETVLDRILTANGFSYEVVDGSIVVVKKEQTPPPSPPVTPTTIEVTGVVLDARNKPLPGAAVLDPVTQTGVSTDGSGAFRLTLPADTKTLEVRYLGMVTRKITIGNQRKLRVIMEEDASKIEDIVVTGIFNKPRESYTGSVSTITAEQLEMNRGQNLIQTLRNIDPSINIIADNVLGSNPNSLPQINIRGNSTLPQNLDEYNSSYENTINSPLVIMDGFEITLQRLMDYNDDEIQSINILKDASATALYGSRGANGVIVIVSKAPQPGKLKITVSAGLDLEIPDLSSYDLLNARELFSLQNEFGLYTHFSQDTYHRATLAYEQRLKDIMEGVDTDWLHYPVRTGVTQRYNARIEGGSDEFRWGTTLGYNKIAGAMKGSERQTFNGAINLSYRYKNIIFQNQLNVTINKGVESPYGSFDTYANMMPYLRPYDENGELTKTFYPLYAGNTKLVGNPLLDAKLNTRNDSRYTELTNNFSIDWNIGYGLSLRGRLGLTRNDSESDYFLPRNHSEFEAEEYQTDEGYFRKGRYEYTTGKRFNYDGSATLNYSRTFNEVHQLYAGVDFSIRNNESRTYYIIVEGFPTENTDFFGDARQYEMNGIPKGSESTTRSVGYLGNVNYTYDNRYYVDGSLRVDGSSQFGTDNRFAPFWSVGAGWSLHNEKFLADQTVVDVLRLRTSYGSSGSQNFDAYQAQATYRYLKEDKYMGRTGAYMIAMGNTDLKWQTTKQFNVGVDADFLDRRVMLTFDYYVKNTVDLLSSMDLPRSTGYASYVDNIGKVQNRGFEVSLSTYTIRNYSSGWIWMLSGKLAYNKNEIKKLSASIKEQTQELLNQNVEVSNLFYEGYSQNSIWAVRSLGIDPSTGRELYFDQYGVVTDVWNPNAKVYCGVGEPKYRGNISSLLRYKDFSLNLSFGYHWGGKVYNSTLRDRVEVSLSEIASRNVDRRVLESRWYKAGDRAGFKGIESDTDMYRSTSRFVMKDNVFELQSASLEYRVSGAKFLENSKMESLRVAVNMSDLFYISTVKRERGTSYPFARRVGMSVSLQF